MDEVVKTIEKIEPSTLDQLGKMLLSATAAFAAGKLAEAAYDKFVIARRNRNTVTVD